jgi:hypothetical protein
MKKRRSANAWMKNVTIAHILVLRELRRRYTVDRGIKQRSGHEIGV